MFDLETSLVDKIHITVQVKDKDRAMDYLKEFGYTAITWGPPLKKDEAGSRVHDLFKWEIFGEKPFQDTRIKGNKYTIKAEHSNRDSIEETVSAHELSRVILTLEIMNYKDILIISKKD